MKSLIVVLVLAFATIGPSIVVAAVGMASKVALGRNPSSATKIMMAMIIALIFVEAVTVMALLVVFQVFTP